MKRSQLYLSFELHEFRIQNALGISSGDEFQRRKKNPKPPKTLNKAVAFIFGKCLRAQQRQNNELWHNGDVVSDLLHSVQMQNAF